MQDKYQNTDIEKQQLNKKKQKNLKRKTKLELEVKDLEESVKEEANAKAEGSKDLKKIEDTIRKKEHDLEKILPQFKEKKSAEEECQRRLEVLTHEIDKIFPINEFVC